MGYEKNKEIDRFNSSLEKEIKKTKSKLCGCNLTPAHYLLEHDWCCQKCGGQHSERICPGNNGD